jgi:hypothetical protein
MNLPVMPAGPLLRRVEPNLVSVSVALKEAGSVKTREKQLLGSELNSAGWTAREGQQLRRIVITFTFTAGVGNPLRPMGIPPNPRHRPVGRS